MTPGTRVGPYTIVRPLALGGMAEVYLARDETGTGPSVVALKRVRDRHATTPRYLRMFRDEIRIAAQLTHPNIARLLDYSMAGASPYYIMEYVRGVTVSRLRWLAQTYARSIPLAVALGVIREAAAALHHAHEKVDRHGNPRCIVHRDVSPSNVLVSLDGAVKVIDFGVAKAARRETETTERLLKGRIGYMSPEQCTGAPLDRRSDIFALGILLYELTTGHTAYSGTDYEILRHTARQAVAPPSTLSPTYPKDLEAVVMRALQRVPDARFPTADHFVAALDQIAHDRGLDLSALSRRRYIVGLLKRHKAARQRRQELDVAPTIVEPVPA